MSEERVEYVAGGQECQVAKARRMYEALDGMRERLSVQVLRWQGNRRIEAKVAERRMAALTLEIEALSWALVLMEEKGAGVVGSG